MIKPPSGGFICIILISPQSKTNKCLFTSIETNAKHIYESGALVSLYLPFNLH